METIKQKELELYQRYKKGDLEAKKELIKSFDPLINSQVQKFSNSGLPVIALKNEARNLVSQAIDTYNPNMGTQLNTHTVNYLKKLSRFTTNYQNVGYIPEPRALKIGQYQTVVKNLEMEKGREPTAAEIADAMNISIKEVERLKTEMRKDLSMNIINEDEDNPGGFYEHIAPQYTDSKLKEAIDFVYFDADPIDKKILEMTLGLFGNQKRTNKEIMLQLNLTETEFNKRKKELATKIKELSQ